MYRFSTLCIRISLKKPHTFIEFTILVNIYQECSVIFPDSFSLDP